MDILAENEYPAFKEEGNAVGGKMRKIPKSLFLFPVLCLVLGCTSRAPEQISPDDAQTILDKVQLFWNEGNPSLAGELYAGDYVRHHPTPGDAASLDDLKDQVAANRTLFPDYRLTLEDTVIEGNKLIVFATVTGTNTAPLDDRPPTGKQIHMQGIYIFRIVEGKIVEEWTYFNLLSYYQQLGYSLSPPQIP